MKPNPLPHPVKLGETQETIYAYQIRHWDMYFENAASRKIRFCSFVNVPNRHDGKGYARLAKDEHSGTLFSRWNLILQVASKMLQRGLLVDVNGPLNANDLADKTRFSAEGFVYTLDKLSLPEIGWIEQIPCPFELIVSGSQNNRSEAKRIRIKGFETSGAEPPPKMLKKRCHYTVQNSTEQKSITDFEKIGDAHKLTDEKTIRSRKGQILSGQRLDWFFAFWHAFDHKHGRADAIDAWLNIEKLDEKLLPKILKEAKREAFNRSDIFARKGTPIWAQGWINARRWEDAEDSKKPDDSKPQEPSGWKALWRKSEAPAFEEEPPEDWNMLPKNYKRELIELSERKSNDPGM